MQVSKIEELNMNEIKQVNGGAWDSAIGAGLTVGLMACAPASLVVMGVGGGALMIYAALSLNNPV